MRKLVGLIVSLALVVSISCNSKPIEPFELMIYDSNYSMAYSLRYQLSNQGLILTYNDGLENKRDSILYSTTDLPRVQLKKISLINVDSLNSSYTNKCIDDGDIKTFRLSKNGKSKTICLENYYHPELSPIVELVNNIVPKKHQMYHDKKDLIAQMKNCEIIESQ